MRFEGGEGVGAGGIGGLGGGAGRASRGWGLGVLVSSNKQNTIKEIGNCKKCRSK